MKIEKASREAILFNEKIVNVFISKILGIKSFFISDDSRIDDMRSFVDAFGNKVSDNEWKFKQTSYDTDRMRKETGKEFFEASKELRSKYKQESSFILERIDVSFDQDIIDKTKELFGASIDRSDLRGTFVDLGKKISSQLTPEKRKELVG